jgi:hypothetical protein
VEVIAAYPGRARFVALGASDVYFTTSDDNVHSVPKTGGAWTTIGPGAYGVTADAANVYVTDEAGAVWQHPIAGGPSIRLDRSNPGYGAVAVYDADVSWCGDNLSRVPIGGAPLGTPPMLVGASVGAPFALAIDETYVYWSDDEALRATPKAGGPDIIVASGAPGFYYVAISIAVDDANVYWAGPNGVWSAPKP